MSYFNTYLNFGVLGDLEVQVTYTPIKAYNGKGLEPDEPMHCYITDVYLKDLKTYITHNLWDETIEELQEQALADYLEQDE